MEQMELTEEMELTEPNEDDYEEERSERKFSANSLRICVDRYDKDLGGRIYSKMSADELRFRNMGELLLRTDELFDERGYPQNFQEKHSFEKKTVWDGRYAPPKILRADEDIRNQSGELCTIDILVISRRRASWQGMIMDRGRPATRFESAKELMELLLNEVRQRT